MDLTVEKKLTIYDVSKIRENILTLLENGQPLQMDLGHVTECDTAGIQLLCSILRTTQKQKIKITINQYSKAITDAARNIGIVLTAGSVKSM